MFLEAVLSYALASNQPVCINSGCQGVMTSELRLNMAHDLSENLYMKLSPYVWLDDHTPKRAGADAEVSYRLGNVDIGLFHSSKHSLDTGTGKGIEIDGIRLRWRIK